MALDKPNYINIFYSLTADRLEKYRQYKTTTFGDLERWCKKSCVN